MCKQLPEYRRPSSGITPLRAADAVKRPLRAYYSVNHNDIVAIHTALAELGILYATSSVHEGWDEVGEDGIIPFRERYLGGHAFAIVAHDINGV